MLFKAFHGETYWAYRHAYASGHGQPLLENENLRSTKTDDFSIFLVTLVVLAGVFLYPAK